MTTVSGSVDRIVFRNPETGFCVARFQLEGDGRDRGGATTIVGTMPAVRTGEMLRVTGEWQIHPVHGRNFRVERFEEQMPTTLDGIERYLSSGAIRGIGPVTASRIVDQFGDRSIVVIDEQSELLRQVAGISSRRLEVIRQSWIEQKRVRELSMFLQEHGLSVALAQRIYDAYGDGAPDVIRQDPYRLAHDIYGVGFRTADEVARKLGVPKNSLSRYVAGLKYALSRATEDGHVFLERRDLLRRAAKLLEADIHDLEAALLELLRRGDAVVDGESVYLTPFYRGETGTAQLLIRLRSTPSALTLDPRFDPARAVMEAGSMQGLVLADKQVRAAEQALREKVSILTGGPGTGKTSTLRTVITALERAGITYCLCAPTGRAAKRAAEATGRSASTIHRLLEYQPGLNRFNQDHNRPLPFDFVVVDEVSMLDTLLFYHLLKAIPRESHLLLVGDADQLPSVGPGNVLRDLMDSEVIPTVTLTDLFRQARGSQIVLAAHEVNSGRLPPLTGGPAADFFFVPAPSDEEALQAIKRLVHDRIPARFGLHPVDDVQVLSPMHAGAVGVATLNTELQRLLNPGGPSKPEVQRGGRTFRLGDKVMQVRNNYEKEIYNGDVGRIVSADAAEASLTVGFSTGTGFTPVAYESAELEELVLAYAVSVHKAQGSEFSAVVMPIVTGHYLLLQRNLLYTAITRARRLCVLVGTEKALAVAAASNQRILRNTGLATRLKTPSDADALQLELV